MAGIKGSMWVDPSDNSLHYIDNNGAERKQVGTITTGSGGERGSIWIAQNINGNCIHYIDYNGAERYLPEYVIGSSSGLSGSIWIETTGIIDHTDSGIYSNSSSGKWVHYEAPAGHTDVYSNSAHSDWTDHSDVHTDHSDHSDYYYYYGFYTCGTTA